MGIVRENYRGSEKIKTRLTKGYITGLSELKLQGVTGIPLKQISRRFVSIGAT